MNVTSNYHPPFFEALASREDMDLKVFYFSHRSQERLRELGSDPQLLEPYETVLGSGFSVRELPKLVPDWEERIHIINRVFSAEMVDYFCAQDVAWCHWSEMPGIVLADRLKFNMFLYRLFYPLYILMKRRDGKQIAKYGLGAFGQGVLARNAFVRMGVPCERTADLFYVPAPLSQPKVPAEKVSSFADGRKVFLCVAALCKRKGIDVLLKAFSKLPTKDWCLVLCGHDRENGMYQSLSERLGIADRVLFLGAYPLEQMNEVYAASTVFVLSSRFDGWGAVLNEAASLGLPMIGTDMCGAAWHVIEHGQNGFRVKAGSVRHLSDAMEKYIVQPELIRQHGVRSKELFFAEFTPERNAERLIDGLRRFGSFESASR